MSLGKHFFLSSLLCIRRTQLISYSSLNSSYKFYLIFGNLFWWWICLTHLLRYLLKCLISLFFSQNRKKGIYAWEASNSGRCIKQKEKVLCNRSGSQSQGDLYWVQSLVILFGRNSFLYIMKIAKKKIIKKSKPF